MIRSLYRLYRLIRLGAPISLIAGELRILLRKIARSITIHFDS